MNKHIPTLTHVIYLMLMYVPAESAATTIDINPKCWESCVGVDALLQQWSDNRTTDRYHEVVRGGPLKAYLGEPWACSGTGGWSLSRWGWNCGEGMRWSSMVLWLVVSGGGELV